MNECVTVEIDISQVLRLKPFLESQGIRVIVKGNPE